MTLVRRSSALLFLLGSALLCGACVAPFPALPDSGEPGTWSTSFAHGGVNREAVVYIPESWSPDTATPMLLNFHGYGGTAVDHMEEADFRPVADAEGFVLVMPQGSLLQGSPHWNSAAPSDDNKSAVDDFGFVELLLDTVGASVSIDAERVYAVGYSNGGMMSFGLACHRSGLVAAVGSVSGAMLDDIGVACTPGPTSVITLHGTADTVLRYEGGDGMRSAAGVVDYWRGINQITDEPTESTTSEAGTTVESFVHAGGTGGTEVHHHRVVDGGHVWLDVNIEGADTNRLLWNFFSRFGRDGAL